MSLTEINQWLEALSDEDPSAEDGYISGKCDGVDFKQGGTWDLGA